MTKKQTSPVGIFAEAAGLYFRNIRQFLTYMTFPVLGQFAGLILICVMSYFYSVNLPFLMQKLPLLDNFSTLIFSVIVITLPGLILFIKAFWEYLVAYGAVNSMLDNMLKSGKVYDFDAHTELIKRRTPSFVCLWLIIGILSIFALCPLLWVPAGVLFVFLILVFQVFTYEPEVSPVGCLKRSFYIIKGHFLSTFLLMISMGLLTYVFIPKLFEMLAGYTKLSTFLVNITIPFVSIFPLTEFNNSLSVLYIQPVSAESAAEAIVLFSVSQLAVQYTLPLRSILWGLWYKNLSKEQIIKSSKKSSKKRPSEKLMTESHKKLDKNILRRAMEKDDE